MSGVKLSGRIKSFDKYSLVPGTNNQEQLIFKRPSYEDVFWRRQEKCRDEWTCAPARNGG